MKAYQRYRDYCVICGKDLPKREMNKILISYSHNTATYPRVACVICDDCLPKFFDNLGIPEPEREINWGKPPEFCRKCGSTVSKTAIYCKSCGAILKRSEQNAR